MEFIAERNNSFD